MSRRGKKSKAGKIILLSVLGALLIAVIAGGIGIYSFISNIRKDMEGDPTQKEMRNIQVEPGDSTRTIAAKLQEAGIIDYSWLFVNEAQEAGLAKKLQIGHYEFCVGASYAEILNVLKKAPNYRPSIRIGFPEGTEVLDIIDRFLEKGEESGAAWTREGFERAINADYDCSLIPAVGTLAEGVPAYARLEGFLYPDTYDFFLDATEEELFAKMIAQFEKKATAAGLAEKAAANNMTVYDAMILGSIIQKESGNVADFALISSVFNNRLKINMKLQSDATVSYMIPKEERLASCTSEQLNKDTAYNVYIRYGLCPTPICCARIEAAVAACEPEASEYYYFIGTPAGETLFSKTYEEHMVKVNKYLR